MNFFTRLILLFCLFNLTTLMHDEIVHREGLLLCRLGNLPHRGLGMLYYAYMKHPDREDYARDYLVNYYVFTKNEVLLEGQRVPVVDNLTVNLAARYVWTKEIKTIRDYVMFEHFKRMKNESK